MEEHRPDKGHHQDRGPYPGQPGGIFGEPDNLRYGPRGPRPALRDRRHEASPGAWLEPEPPVRGGHRPDGALVPGQPGVDGQYHLRGV